MKISTKGRYGLRTLIDIAAHTDEGCIAINSVARRLGLSEHYLEQLIATMKKAGFVKSVRGAQGGYSLNCIPGETSAWDILTALEGSLSPVDCLTDTEKCSCGNASHSACVTKNVWAKIYDSLSDTLSAITLEDLVNDYRNIELGVDVHES